MTQCGRSEWAARIPLCRTAMTAPHEVSYLPCKIDVICPDSPARATYHRRQSAHLVHRASHDWFEKQPGFSVERYFLHGWKHAAIHWPGLTDRPFEDIEGMPEGITPADFEAVTPGGYLPTEPGTVICPSCRLRRRHSLAWPIDAWFQITYRSQTLWAYNDESFQALKGFIAAEHRHVSDWRPWPFLMRIPSVFLTAKARPEVLKRLNALDA